MYLYGHFHNERYHRAASQKGKSKPPVSEPTQQEQTPKDKTQKGTPSTSVETGTTKRLADGVSDMCDTGIYKIGKKYSYKACKK